MNNSPALSAAPRSRVVRWVSLLALGYFAGGTLLVRDYIVQTRTATRSQAARPAPVNDSAFANR